MFKVDTLFILVIVGLTVAMWTQMSRPISMPPWPQAVRGYAFAPALGDRAPGGSSGLSLTAIHSDLALLAESTRALRTYSVEGPFADMPALARAHDLVVTPGVWLDGDRRHNEVRLSKLLDVVARTNNVDRVIAGNETLLRNDLSTAELTGYLDWLRTRLDIPVSTAEPWHVWLRHPDLAAHVDFITVHLLPYWEGIDVHEAVAYVGARMQELAAAFPEKSIVIGEVGWPSRGRSRGEAVASRANQATFLREFLHFAEQKGYDYFLLEAFDQPWKRASEGDVGAYWGVYDAYRRPKFAFSGPVSPVPGWGWLAVWSALLAVTTFRLLVSDGRNLRHAGRTFLALVAVIAACSLMWVVDAYTRQQYWTGQSIVMAGVLAAAVAGMTMSFLAEAHEWAEARWSRRRRRPYAGADAGTAMAALPKVSLHVPAHNEPPEMLCQTLRAVAALDYPNLEVLVVDNNTRDETVWQPVEALCFELGPRFRFFHAAPLSGYKAGALNFALRHTAADASVIGVIDSDYTVKRSWLRELTGLFADPYIAIVQAPQDYRDAGSRMFKALCEAEYRGFFHIGMVTRNERNAIIQHGTMTLVRKRVLEEVGGWAEWTVTEDAELGLRILEHGYQAIYVPISYGRGLTPDNFRDYQTQRFRWAFGAVQILRNHWQPLLGQGSTGLSRGQRYHFLAGWLPWLADGVNLVVSVAAVLWSALMLVAPRTFDPPLVAFSALPLGLFAFRMMKTVHLYRSCLGASIRETLLATLAGLGLSCTVGKAVLLGLFRKRTPFVRTPRLANRASLVGAGVATKAEAMLALALLAAAASVGLADPYAGADLSLWRALLVVLALPHLAAIAVSVMGALARWRAPEVPNRGPERALGDAVAETGEPPQ